MEGNNRSIIIQMNVVQTSSMHLFQKGAKSGNGGSRFRAVQYSWLVGLRPVTMKMALNRELSYLPNTIVMNWRGDDEKKESNEG